MNRAHGAQNVELPLSDGCCALNNNYCELRRYLKDFQSSRKSLFRKLWKENFLFSPLTPICSIGQLECVPFRPLGRNSSGFIPSFAYSSQFFVYRSPLSPCGFHCKPSFTMAPSGFLIVCPIHFRFLISIWIGSWSDLCWISYQTAWRKETLSQETCFNKPYITNNCNDVGIAIKCGLNAEN